MTKKSEPKPNIQIDDEVREMTDAEYASYLAEISTSDDVPTAVK